MKAAIIPGVNPFHTSSLKPEKRTHTSVNARHSAVVTITQVIGSLTDRMIHVTVRAKANLTARAARIVNTRAFILNVRIQDIRRQS